MLVYGGRNSCEIKKENREIFDINNKARKINDEQYLIKDKRIFKIGIVFIKKNVII